MFQITTRLPAFSGVAAGQTATAQLPIGLKYHDLYLAYSGVTLAQMTEVRVKANGKVIQRYSATQRDALNQFDGLAAAAGVLTIPFDRHGLKQRNLIELTGLNTGVADKNGKAITSVEIEVDIDAAATAPVLSMRAKQSEATPGGPGAVRHVLPFTRTSAGAGELEISDLPRNSAVFAGINRLAFVSGAISRVEIERSTRIIFDRETALNEVIQADGVRVPQSGYWIVDTTENGYGLGVIDTVGYSDLRYRLTMTGAGTVTCIVEYIGALGE